MAFSPRCTRSKSAGDINTRCDPGSTAATTWLALRPYLRASQTMSPTFNCCHSGWTVSAL